VTARARTPKPQPRRAGDELDRKMRAGAGRGIGQMPDNPYWFLREHKNKPRWTDEPAVCKLVNEVRDAELEEERWFYTHQQFQLPPVVLPAAVMAGIRAMQAQAAPPPPTAEERGAMEAALRGEPDQLTRLVEGGRCNAPSARRMAAELMTGARNPRTGKLKRKSGRPKMSRRERRARNPVHDAADEFVALRDMLLALYPEHRGEQINGLAEKIAKARTGARASVQNYLHRATKAPQRLR
jgi:hypothetical protein